MLNTAEKSAEGVLGARQVRLVRHCNVERRSPGYAAHCNVSALKARTVPREGIEREALAWQVTVALHSVSPGGASLMAGVKPRSA
jgi:hypothetical protein